MFRNLVVLLLIIVVAKAGYLGAPLALHAPIVAAPVAVKAAVPIATSYQNTLKISAAPIPVVVKAAPVVHYASAPAVHFAPAPAIIKSSLFAAPLAYH